MFLIIETNGRVKKSLKWPKEDVRLDPELIGNAVRRVFPGYRVVGPGEAPGGPVQVVTVYVARDKAGAGRLSGVEQWGVARYEN